jgi:hypothetical protein
MTPPLFPGIYTKKSNTKYLYEILSKVLGNQGERSEQTRGYLHMLVLFPQRIFSKKYNTKYLYETFPKYSWNTWLCKLGVAPLSSKNLFQERRGHRGTLVPYPRSIILNICMRPFPNILGTPGCVNLASHLFPQRIFSKKGGVIGEPWFPIQEVQYYISYK